jgi:hypothetical protein
MQPGYYVKTVWDEEASVWCSRLKSILRWL